jgi:zinc/manganese transport system permease protein
MNELLELQWMLPPLTICLILSGIHCYLGIHVLCRKVIFVDLALAQVAALGTTFAFLLGYEPGLPEDSAAVYLFSLTFTFLGAAVFAVSRMRHERVPQEAFIGIVYATTTALAILMLSQSTAETEHIKSMLVGNVLLVTWPTIINTALIYIGLGIFYYFLHRQFFQISIDPVGAEKAGMNIRWWDFLFYASFGIVITSAVAIAGVLLVFTYLVVPAAIGVMFADDIRKRLGIAWGIGVFCSLLGILLSYYGDLPTGPSVVTACAVILICAGVVYYITQTTTPVHAVLKTVLWGTITLAVLTASSFLRKTDEHESHTLSTDQSIQELTNPDISVQLEAIQHLSESRDARSLEPLAALLRRTESDRVAEKAVAALGLFGDLKVVPVLLETASRNLDPFLNVSIGEAIFSLHHPEGFAVLLEVVADESAAMLARDDALDLISQYSGNDFRVQDGAQTSYESAQLNGQQWWADNRNDIQWHQILERFE